jgi:hypothetical protein
MLAVGYALEELAYGRFGALEVGDGFEQGHDIEVELVEHEPRQPGQDQHEEHVLRSVRVTHDEAV